MPRTESLLVRFGAALRDVREGLGFSQRDAAMAMGVSQPTLSRVERGLEELTVGTLEGRAAALGLEVDLVLRRRVPLGG